jgi:hypothetical protein
VTILFDSARVRKSTTFARTLITHDPAPGLLLCGWTAEEIAQIDQARVDAYNEARAAMSDHDAHAYAADQAEAAYERLSASVALRQYGEEKSASTFLAERETASQAGSQRQHIGTTNWTCPDGREPLDDRDAEWERELAETLQPRRLPTARRKPYTAADLDWAAANLNEHATDYTVIGPSDDVLEFAAGCALATARMSAGYAIL